MRLAKRVKEIKPSATLAISAKAKAMKKAGHKVYPMAAGEPDFPTPEHIRSACCKAMEDGHTGYAPSAGIPELRQVLRDNARMELGVEYSDEQVVVGLGAKQCLYNCMQSVLEPGDGLLLQAPYWVSYPAQALLAGANSVMLAMPDGKFGLNRKALEELDEKNLRMMVINSPSNPSGAVLSGEDLDLLARFALERDMVVVTDDIYAKLVYGKRPEHILIRHPELVDRTVVVNGLSKTYSMTGWRLGWALGPREIISAMRKIQDQSTSNAVTFVQHAALAALASPAEVVQTMRDEFARRRDAIVHRLNALDGVSCHKPSGAFYAFASFEEVLKKRFEGELIGSTLRLAELMLEHERIAVVPGEAFGAPGYLRFSFACSLDTIEEAMDHLESFLSKIV